MVKDSSGWFRPSWPKNFVAYCASWHLPEALPPLSPAPQDIMLRVRPLEAADWAEVPLAIQIEGAVVLLRLTLK